MVAESGYHSYSVHKIHLWPVGTIVLKGDIRKHKLPSLHKAQTRSGEQRTRISTEDAKQFFTRDTYGYRIISVQTSDLLQSNLW